MALSLKKPVIPFIPVVYLAAIGLLLNSVAYYPGFMSPDTLDQFDQSLTQQYRDWHPLLMAWFWSFLNQIYPGPQPMFFFQLILLWVSYFLLADSWFQARKSRFWLFLLFLLAPFIQNFSGYIVKDVQMGLCWLLSFCLISRAEYRSRKMTAPEAIISIILLLYGSLVRINALPGVLPLLLLWLSNIFANRKAIPLIFGTFFFLIIVICCQFLLNNLLQPEKKYPEYKLYLHDIAGIYVKTGKNYFPDFVTDYPGFNLPYLKENYTTATLDDLYWNAEQKIAFPEVDQTTIPVIQNAWIKSITSSPGAYLWNRFDGYLQFLRIKKRSWLVYLHAEISPNSYGLTFKRNVLSEFFLKQIKLHSKLPYMEPWFWFLLNVVLVVSYFYMAHSVLKKGVLALGLSGLMYILPQFFIFQVDTDFRYFYWNCLAGTIGLVLYFKDRNWKKANNKTTVVNT